MMWYSISPATSNSLDGAPAAISPSWESMMENESNSTGYSMTTDNATVFRAPIDQIDEPPEPLRQTIDQQAIAELADSLNHYGQLVPIILTQTTDRLQIIAGHRRFLAARLLNWTHIDARIFNGPPIDHTAISAAENLQREDLTAIEESRIVFDMHHTQGLEIRAIMHRLNKGEGWVQSRLDIAFMPDYIKDEIAARRISIGVARELMGIEEEEHRRYLVGMAVNFGCTVRMAQSWRQQWRAQQPMKDEQAKAPPPAPYAAGAGEVTLPCWFCSEQHTIPLLSVVRLCPDCLRSADQARTGRTGPPTPGN